MKPPAEPEPPPAGGSSPSRSPRRAPARSQARAGLTLLVFFFTLATAGRANLIQGRVQNFSNGLYLHNARVHVAGTNREVFTNQYGEFQIDSLPAGKLQLEVFYTGLESQSVPVDVNSAVISLPDIQLPTIGPPHWTADSPTVVLDQMVVRVRRETNAANIATNEQRFADTPKVVVAADAFGDVNEGNVGEFVKFLPGVTVNYVSADVRTMSVRGFPDAFTQVAFDGIRLANASSGEAQRAFEFEQVSLNNISRVEIVLSPTPDLPADLLGGSVNLISKNVFERAEAQLRFRAFANVNDEAFQFLRRTPGPGQAASYKVLPGFDFDYSLPITRNFGIVLTGLTSNQFNQRHHSQTEWNFAQSGASTSNPYLQSYTVLDGPKLSFRDSFSLKADWRLPNTQFLSASVQYNRYQSLAGDRTLTWDAGTSTDGNAPMHWGPDFTEGAAGQGRVFQDLSFRDKYGATSAGNVSYRYKTRLWQLDLKTGGSLSRSWYRDTDHGHFGEVIASLADVSRVSIQDNAAPRPGSLQASAADGTLLDPTVLRNYHVDSVRAEPVDSRDQAFSVQCDVRRQLDILPFNVAIKGGAAWRVQTRDLRKTQSDWTYVGPDGRAQSGDETAAPYLDTRYGADPQWGLAHIQWTDPSALFAAFKQHPDLFVQTPSQQSAQTAFAYRNSGAIKEQVPAAYLQMEGRFFDNQLDVVAGVRTEWTRDLAQGPAHPLEAVQERAQTTDRRYGSVFPSAQLSYSLAENLILRTGYARTFGRPDFNQVLPLVRVNDSPTAVDDGLGTIDSHTVVVSNPQLRPWQADNVDLGLEYYLHDGGQGTVSIFGKRLTDSWRRLSAAVTTTDLAALELPAAALGDRLDRLVNDGTAFVTGMTVGYSQPLRFLPPWATEVRIFGNATRLNTSEKDPTGFGNLITNSANWGVTYTRSPLIIMVKCNYRGRQRRFPLTGEAYGASNGFFEYYAPRINTDVNIECQLGRHLALFVNARNLFNVPQQLEHYAPGSPNYSRFFSREEFGVQIAAGISGTY